MARGRRRRSGRGTKPSRDRKVDLERYRPFMDDWDAFLAAAARPEPTVLRTRVGRIEPEELTARLSAQGFRLRTLEGLPGFLQVEDGPAPVSQTLEHWLGLCYVQQASTGVAAPALGPRPEERVLDLCSAPGGKTTHICQLMGDRGCVVASEISESRIRGLLGNVYRLGHPNVLVVSGDGREFPEGALFDRVLVDAPCSGEGTLRRRAGNAPDQSASFMGYVTRAQRALLANAVRLTKPGGVVMYVTCTFAPEENEAVVSEALETLPVELVPLDLPVPHAPGLTWFGDERYDERLAGAARIYPHHLDSGGLFLAKLRRLEDDAVDVDAGWSGVPALFPDVEADAEPDAESDTGSPSSDAGSEPADPEGADDADPPDPPDPSPSRLIEAGLEEIRGRYGLAGAVDDLGWTMRGGRAWMHSVGEWPLEAWEAGSWRAISIGIRAIDFDSRGRPRPTNDLLRWADAGSGAVDLTPDHLRRLLAREALPTEIDRRGPIALAYGGDVIGRGAVTVDGLKSEVPKARAKDLLRILDRG